MIGWIGNAFILSGILAIAYQKRIGFALGIVGNSFWCYRGLMTSQYDLLTIEVIIVALQVFSWWNWGRYVNTIHSGTGGEQ